MVGFFEVVVFGGEPEDGDGVRCILACGCAVAALRRVKRGPPKRRDLLAGDDGAGLPGGGGRCLARVRAGAEAAVLSSSRSARRRGGRGPGAGAVHCCK